MNPNIIPVFYACDDNFVKFSIVSITSMMEHASKDFQYKIYVLHTNITENMKEKIYSLSNENFEFIFYDMTSTLGSVSKKLPLRDYYSKTTYFRIFIANIFPEYHKAIYIDSDTIVAGDISKLYITDIEDHYLGACHEQVMVQVNEYGTYVETVLGISRHNYFNAGLLLINCEQFRLHSVLDKFMSLLQFYNFAVTQDEDYLNVICKDRVFWLDQTWNTEVFGNIPYPIEEANIIHYIMVNKPWHYRDCRFGDIFWHYAEKTEVYSEITAILEAYTEEERLRDKVAEQKLLALAVSETNREDHYLARVNQSRAADRVAVVKKIEDYEKEGRFDEDVEEDPPSKVLMPDQIDYIRKNWIDKTKTKVAYGTARIFYKRMTHDQKLIIKEIRGIENFRNLQSGAVVTCNHFNAFDSFAMQIAYDQSGHKDRTFYRVIREGNYTSFGGFYGFLMRNCNTLPLSSNYKTMAKLIKATDQLLRGGHFVLVYPEQSMWWNYRKPKPLKEGAFMFASKSNVPVLPCFITMKDTDICGDDGFAVQEYTIHIAKPIYPPSELSYRENVEYLMNENARVWKEIYETEYQIPLSYTTVSKES